MPQILVDPPQAPLGIIPLGPSGDTTGATDTARLAASIALFPTRIMLLPGNFYFSRTAIASINGGSANCPYCIQIGNAVEIWGSGRNITIINNANQHQTGAVGDTPDNVFLITGNPSGVMLRDFTIAGNSQVTDPLTTSAGTNGYGIVIAGIGSISPTFTRIQDVAFTALRNGSINHGGDTITAFSQVPTFTTIDGLWLNMTGKARAFLATGMAYGTINHVQGLAGDEFSINGLWNHIKISNVNLLHDNTNNPNIGTALRIAGNNSIQACTDIQIVDFGYTGKSLNGVIIQNNNVGASNTVDGVNLVGVETELASQASGSNQNFQLLTGTGTAPIGVTLTNCIARTATSDGFLSQFSCTFNGCFAELNGGNGFNCTGGNNYLIGCRAASNTGSGLAIGGGTVQVNTFTALSNASGFNYTAGTLNMTDGNINGNTTAFAGTLTGTCRVRDTLGFNPHTAVTAPITAPVTATTYQNTTGVDCFVQVTQTAVTGTHFYVSQLTPPTTGGIDYGAQTAWPTVIVIPAQAYFQFVFSAGSIALTWMGM